MPSAKRGVDSLYWATSISNYGMWLVMAYLTEVWGLNLTDAAAMLNLWRGATEILPVAMLFLADSLLTDSGIILISILSSTAGLGFLFMSTPPVLAKVTGTCSEYKPECIGSQQKILFYTALALTAVGTAGFNASVDEFKEAQTDGSVELGDDDGNCSSFVDCFGTLTVLGGLVALLFVKLWIFVFGIVALCMLAATSMFLNSILHYYDEIRGCPMSLSFTFSFSSTFRIAPLSLLFVLCGVVSSIGDTYFVEQVNLLSTKLGSANIPLIIFPQIHGFMKDRMTLLTLLNQLHSPALAFISSLVLSVLCCATATGVESRRLDLVAKPDEAAPMSVLWMIPCYMLLGAFDGLFKKSMEIFFSNETSRTVSRYAVPLANAVFGLGIMGSALSVYTVETVTSKNGTMGWFGNTLNKSRLDKYYLILAVISSVGLAVLLVLLPCYSHPLHVTGQILCDTVIQVRPELAPALASRAGEGMISSMDEMAYRKMSE